MLKFEESNYFPDCEIKTFVDVYGADKWYRTCPLFLSDTEMTGIVEFCNKNFKSINWEGIHHFIICPDGTHINDFTNGIRLRSFLFREKEDFVQFNMVYL